MTNLSLRGHDACFLIVCILVNYQNYTTQNVESLVIQNTSNSAGKQTLYHITKVADLVTTIFLCHG